jgi:hypothetical protein
MVILIRRLNRKISKDELAMSIIVVLVLRPSGFGNATVSIDQCLKETKLFSRFEAFLISVRQSMACISSYRARALEVVPYDAVVEVPRRIIFKALVRLSDLTERTNFVSRKIF